MGERLSELLEPIAAFFRSLNTPEPIVHWGHPVMMGIVVLVMGSYVAYAGWKSRLTQDGEVANKNRADRRKLAPLMFLFIALGYTGGILSLVMQHQPILESPYFWTGLAVLLVLGTNGLIATTGFGGDSPQETLRERKEVFRTFHAYLGSATMILLIVHAILGLNLGLSI
jgi:F0F1-type ATP synthase membrane subunit c/vacuolar-type H+-ATPase subunit K